MDLRHLALQILPVIQEAGSFAMQEQMSPKDLLRVTTVHEDIIERNAVSQRVRNVLIDRITNIQHFDGLWQDKPLQPQPGQRFWCIGGIDGVINYSRNMAEWVLPVSLFECNSEGSTQPVIGIVHAPALMTTYIAVEGKGAIKIRYTDRGQRREKIMPSTTKHLQGSVVSYGMSFYPAESRRALATVAAIAGRPADIKRVGPAALDLCRVADGTYDAYFEPHLHEWDIPAVSAGTVVVWQAQGRVRQWSDTIIHWRRENDIIATNGQIDDEIFACLVRS